MLILRCLFQKIYRSGLILFSFNDIITIKINNKHVKNRKKIIKTTFFLNGCRVKKRKLTRIMICQKNNLQIITFKNVNRRIFIFCF